MTLAEPLELVNSEGGLVVGGCRWQQDRWLLAAQALRRRVVVVMLPIADPAQGLLLPPSLDDGLPPSIWLGFSPSWSMSTWICHGSAPPTPSAQVPMTPGVPRRDRVSAPAPVPEGVPSSACIPRPRILCQRL
jgi:hypothetical protein